MVEDTKTHAARRIALDPERRAATRRRGTDLDRCSRKRLYGRAQTSRDHPGRPLRTCWLGAAGKRRRDGRRDGRSDGRGLRKAVRPAELRRHAQPLDPCRRPVQGRPQRLSNATKYVASSSLDTERAWPNSTLLTGDVPAAVAALREQPGGNLVIMGSGRLIRSLLAQAWSTSCSDGPPARARVRPASVRRRRRDAPAAARRLTQTETGVLLVTYQPLGGVAENAPTCRHRTVRQQSSPPMLLLEVCPRVTSATARPSRPVPLGGAAVVVRRVDGVGASHCVVHFLVWSVARSRSAYRWCQNSSSKTVAMQSRTTCGPFSSTSTDRVRSSVSIDTR